jgi:hypothetical protein
MSSPRRLGILRTSRLSPDGRYRRSETADGKTTRGCAPKQRVIVTYDAVPAAGTTIIYATGEIDITIGGLASTEGRAIYSQY